MTAGGGGEGCRLPAHARMRYWRPAPALAGLVSGYHLYAVAPPEGETHRDVFQPAWANLRFVLTPQTEWRVRVEGQPSLRVESWAVFGPTSTVMWSESDAGIAVGAGLTPLGWARLTAQRAADWANRVEACPSGFGTDFSGVYETLRAASADEAIPEILDQVLTGALVRPTRIDDGIRRMGDALLDPAITGVTQLSAALDLAQRTLERIAARAFGFPPKLLLRRARFLRSLHAIRMLPSAARSAGIDPGYTDYPHFVRDSHEFLGMAPQRFLKLRNPLFEQSLRLRDEVLGAPAQALAPLKG